MEESTTRTADTAKRIAAVILLTVSFGIGHGAQKISMPTTGIQTIVKEATQ